MWCYVIDAMVFGTKSLWEDYDDVFFLLYIYTRTTYEKDVLSHRWILGWKKNLKGIKKWQHIIDWSSIE